MAPFEVLCLPTPFLLPSCRSKMSSGSLPLRGTTFSLPESRRVRIAIDALPVELLALVFQHLHDIDSRSLAQVRLVSRFLNIVATPIHYEELVLNSRIVQPRNVNSCPEGLDNTFRHTKHVTVRSDLNAHYVNEFLDRTRSCSSVKWLFVPSSRAHDGRILTPEDILEPARPRRRAMDLHVECMSLKDLSDTMQDAVLASIPTEPLVSLKLASSSPPLTTRPDSLGRLIIAARRLRTLHYEDRGQGIRFNFRPNERLPPLRDLVLRSYDWGHLRGGGVQEQERLHYMHWDFSQLRSLRLVDVPLGPFLESAVSVARDLGHFRDLETLQCDDFSAHLPRPDYHRPEATRNLFGLVRNSIHNLQCLEITCHTSSFKLVDALGTSSSQVSYESMGGTATSIPNNHAATLRRLRFRDYVGFGSESRRCPTLSTEEIGALSDRLDRLKALELDMDADYLREHDENAEEFLEEICNGFPGLEELTLHVQTTLRPHISDRDSSEQRRRYDEDLRRAVMGEDPDREAAEDIVRTMVRERETQQQYQRIRGGASAQHVSSFRRITINVGGWRPYLVRRMSEVWRMLNSRGVYAERCFVVERDDHGVMRMREEEPLES